MLDLIKFAKEEKDKLQNFIFCLDGFILNGLNYIKCSLGDAATNKKFKPLDSTQLPKFFSSKQEVCAPQTGSLLSRHGSMKQNTTNTKLIYSNLRTNDSMGKHSQPANEPLYDVMKNKYRNLFGNSEKYSTGKELIDKSDIVGSAKNIFASFENGPVLGGTQKGASLLNREDTGKGYRGGNYENNVITSKYNDLKTKDQSLQNRRLEAATSHRHSQDTPDPSNVFNITTKSGFGRPAMMRSDAIKQNTSVRGSTGDGQRPEVGWKQANQNNLIDSHVGNSTVGFEK